MTNSSEIDIRNETNKNAVEDLDQKNFKCNQCDALFSKRSSLNVHISSHQIPDDGNVGGKNICQICYKNFTTKRNLVKHLKGVHKDFNEADKMMIKKLKCPMENCEFKCRSMQQLRDHIENCHNIIILKDWMEFRNEKAFQVWKKAEESNSVSKFVSIRKVATLTDGTKKQTLVCHRTGNYSPKGMGKYRMKSVGSCKIGVTCPALMELSKLTNGQVSVIYYKTHLGHALDPEHLTLSTEEIAFLSEKMKQGFSFDSILEDVKESNCSIESKKNRLQFLSKRDLYRIRRAEGIKSKSKTKKADRLNDLLQSKETENVNNLVKPKECIKSSNQLLISQEQNSLLQKSKEGLATELMVLSPEKAISELLVLPIKEPISSKKHFPEYKNNSKISRTVLQQTLQEKLDKITEFLPDTEILTSKEFESIKAKLDFVLNVFCLARNRVTKRWIRKRNIVRDWTGTSKTARITGIKPKRLEKPQFQETSIVYEVQNKLPTLAIESHY